MGQPGNSPGDDAFTKTAAIGAVFAFLLKVAVDRLDHSAEHFPQPGRVGLIEFRGQRPRGPNGRLNSASMSTGFDCSAVWASSAASRFLSAAASPGCWIVRAFTVEAANWKTGWHFDADAGRNIVHIYS